MELGAVYGLNRVRALTTRSVFPCISE